MRTRLLGLVCDILVTVAGFFRERAGTAAAGFVRALMLALMFWLPASLPPSAVGQINVNAAIISVTIDLSCSDTNFLNPNSQSPYTGDYDFIITGGSIYGSPAEDKLCNGTLTFPDQNLPGLSGFFNMFNSTETGTLTTTVPLTVNAWFNQIAAGTIPCTPYPAANYYAPFTINNSYLNLANGETYYLTNFPTGSVTPQVNAQDPRYPANLSGGVYPTGNISVTDTEIPGVIPIIFQCTNDNGTLPKKIQINNLFAYNPATGEYQAGIFNTTFYYVDPNPIYLLARSGSSYTVYVYYNTGSNLYTDTINYLSVFNNVTVQACSVVTNLTIGLDCSGNPLGCGATITGNFGMGGKEINWPSTFFLVADSGPVGNQRWVTFHGVTTPTIGFTPFTAINVVPSAFFFPQVAVTPYQLDDGRLSFGTYSDFEYFNPPTYYSVEAVNCQTTNLDVFELCPGYVQGT